MSHNHLVTPRELADSICDTLLRNGHQALLVGGCVRDLLLGRDPEDYDVCTDATPDRVISLFPESVAVGAQFGVILIPLDTHKVEVATFAQTSVPLTGATRNAWCLPPALNKMYSGAISLSTVS